MRNFKNLAALLANFGSLKNAIGDSGLVRVLPDQSFTTVSDSEPGDTIIPQGVDILTASSGGDSIKGITTNGALPAELAQEICAAMPDDEPKLKRYTLAGKSTSTVMAYDESGVQSQMKLPAPTGAFVAYQGNGTPFGLAVYDNNDGTDTLSIIAVEVVPATEATGVPAIAAS